MPAEVNEETKRDIVRLRAGDYTKVEIGECLGLSRNTVRRHLRRFQERFNRGDADIDVIDGPYEGDV